MSAKIYIFRQEQWIPRPINEVFAFFSDARNLEAITPPWLGFKTVAMSSDVIEEGTEIRHRLSLRGIPIKWRTEIRKWDPPHCFVDFQVAGPYKLWHHTHRFQSFGNRTRMNDVVRYTLPLGALGRLVHAFKVRSEVHRIFEYRRKRIDEVFGRREKASAIA